MKNKKYIDSWEEEKEEEIISRWEKYIQKIVNARKLFYKVTGIAAILGIILALTTPKIYTVKATLAPESTRTSSNGLSNITSMLGFGNLNLTNESDALKVILYPDIVSSTPFILDLLDTPVKTKDNDMEQIPFITYLTEHTKSSLISMIISLPFQAINGIKSFFIGEKNEVPLTEQKINPFQLTKKQASLVKGLKRMIVTKVDKKTGMTTVSITMQDPLVAAIMTDTVIVKLKEHITRYRISKAEADYKYWEQLYHERQKEYHIKQQAYANYVDANKNIILQSVRIEQVRLQNEMNLAYQVYSNVATQLQMARAKVQESKPVFAVVEPASVPLMPSGKGRKTILIGVVFLSIIGTAVWVLFWQDLWNNIKTFVKKEKNIKNNSKQQEEV